MYAIIETGGKQYRVAPGETIRVEKLPGNAGDTVVFDRVLAVSKDGQLTVGNPLVAGAKVTGKILKQDKYPKILVLKYKAKVNYRRRYGHRQPYTEVAIEQIEA
ncbi:MAG: 50S ribosomal protein L21 [Firmicutes bacterium]|nr:50S ribosomal protein L21 [Bacillota bacterium]